MKTNNNKTNEDYLQQIDTLFLVLQSVGTKWTTPETIANVIKNQIININDEIEKQVETITIETFNLLTNNSIN